MKFGKALVVCLPLVLAACASAPKNSVYQSNAPELRGERAITSNIELAAEVDLTGSILGVFYSDESYQDGGAQVLLFTRRPSTLSRTAGTVVDYNLAQTSSLSVPQGQKLVSAIEEYLGKDPKSLQPSQMFNYELYSGTVDMAAGNEHYRPFKDITFLVVCSVTSSGKSFKTVFPGTAVNIYGQRTTTYDTFDLTTAQVQKLHDAIKAALARATPEVSR